MKRIDVLKGIEQILVQKAYEAGHISHRADGDWQKQADGSWIPYKGQSNQSAPQAQKPIENTEYGEITEEDLVETSNEEDSNDWEEDDTEGYYGNSGGLRSTIYEGAYDTQISNIGNTEEDDYGNSVPNDEAVENVVRGIMQEWTGDTDDEDAVEAVHDGLKDAVLDRWFTIENTEYGEITEEDLKGSNTTDKKGYEDFGFSEPRTKKQARKLIEDIADRLEQEYPNINDMLKNREHIDGDFQREQEETVNDVMEKLGLKNLTDGDYYTRDAVESLYAKIHGHWYDEENSPQSDNADNNHEKYNINGDVRQKIKDLAYKYNAIYDNGDFDTEQTEDIMREVGLDPTDDSQLDAFSDVMYDIGHGVEKSAFRDMRSTPTVKNMGF